MEYKVFLEEAGEDAILYIDDVYIKTYHGQGSGHSCILVEEELRNLGDLIFDECYKYVDLSIHSHFILTTSLTLDEIKSKIYIQKPIVLSAREHHMLEMMNNFRKYHYDYLIKLTSDISTFMTFNFKLIVNPYFEESNHYETFFIKENGENVFEDDGRIIPNSNNDFKLLKNKKVYKINELLNSPIKEENKIKKERQEIVNSIYDFLIKETNCEINNGYIDYIEYYFLGDKEDIYNLFSVDKYLINMWLDEYEYNIKSIDESDDEIYDILTTDFLETFWENKIDDSYLFDNQYKIKEMITPEKFVLYKLSQYIPYDCSKNLIKNK